MHSFSFHPKYRSSFVAHKNTPPSDPDTVVLVIYEWGAWDHFLIRALVPNAHHLPARPGEPARAVLSAIPPGATGLLVHVNLSDTTHVPIDRHVLLDELDRRDVRVWNRLFPDIRKRALQERLLRLGLPSTLAGPEGPPDEPVMVKTDFNYGAQFELRLSGPDRRRLGLDPGLLPFDGAQSYRVMRRDEVPRAWWSHRGLVVERYVANDADRFHRVYVAGTHLVVSEAVCPGPIKKLSSDLDRVNTFVARSDLSAASGAGSLPHRLAATLRIFLDGTALDVGAIDLMYDGADYYVVDVNTTPYWKPWGGGQSGIIDHLRAGLRAHAPDGTAALLHESLTGR